MIIHQKQPKAVELKALMPGDLALYRENLVVFTDRSEDSTTVLVRYLHNGQMLRLDRTTMVQPVVIYEVTVRLV